MKSSTHRVIYSPTIIVNISALVLIILGLSLRLYDLTDQPIDFHPTRQLRGAIIARGMYYEMFHSADSATQQQAIAFWQSTGQYEPSILERITAITYGIIGEEKLWIARLYNSIFWVFGGTALFFLARRMAASTESGSVAGMKTGDIAALIALAYYLVLPFGVQASRSFQPDPGMTVWLILYAYTIFRWSETSRKGKQAWIWAVCSGLFGGLTALTKAVAVYTVAGLAIATTLSKIFSPQINEISQSKRISKTTLTNALRELGTPQIWIMALLMIAPTAIYYLGRGARASEYFSSWTAALSHLLLEPWFYGRWLNLVGRLLGWPFLLVVAISLVMTFQKNSKRHTRALLLGLWGGYIAYGLFLPYQMYTHSYYHLQLVPIVAISLIPTTQAVLESFFTPHNRILRLALMGLMLTVLAYSSWIALQPLYGQDYRNEPEYWQQIASYLPSDGKIIGLTQDYGYRLMYYGWRKIILWPNRGEQNLSSLRGSEKEFEDYFIKRTEGKSYFLVTAFKQFEDQPDLKQYLYSHYTLLAENPGYVIFDLTHLK